MNKTGRALISLYLLHQGVRLAKITTLVLLFGFASWRVIDGSASLFEGNAKEVTTDPSDLLAGEDALAHFRALLLFKSHCQVNQDGDLVKISWLLSSTDSQMHEPLYLKKGAEVQIPQTNEERSAVSVAFGGSYPGITNSARIFLKSGERTLEIALPIESAPLVPLSQQQLQTLGLRYLGINLLPPEESGDIDESQLPITPVSTRDEMIPTVSRGDVSTRIVDLSYGVFEDLKNDSYYYVSSHRPPSSTIFDPLFPKGKIASASFESEKALFELFDERGFLMKIEIPKIKDKVFAKDYFKQILLERVTLGAALINFKQVRTPIKMGRLYLLNEKGCLDLSDRNLRDLYAKGELIGQVVVYQEMIMNGTKKEARFEVIDASRTYEEERVLVHDAKRMDSNPRPALPSTRQTPKPRPSKVRQRTTGNQKRQGPETHTPAGHMQQTQSNLSSVNTGWFE